MQYLGVNVPHAWAAGSVFQFVQAMLGIQTDAPHGKLHVDPTLPDWLPSVTLEGLKLGQGPVRLRFWREGDQTRWEVLSAPGNLHVEEKKWEPWKITPPPTE